MNVPYQLEKDARVLTGMMTRGDGVYMWRFRGEWRAQHPEMHPEFYLFAKSFESLSDMADAWMADRRKRKAQISQ